MSNPHNEHDFRRRVPREADSQKRICGACGDPIYEDPLWTRWGPVHPHCGERVPDGDDQSETPNT